MASMDQNLIQPFNPPKSPNNSPPSSCDSDGAQTSRVVKTHRTPTERDSGIPEDTQAPATEKERENGPQPQSTASSHTTSTISTAGSSTNGSPPTSSSLEGNLTTTHDSSVYSMDQGDGSGEEGARKDYYKLSVQEKSKDLVKGRKKKASGGSRPVSSSEMALVYPAPEYRHKWVIQPSRHQKLDNNRDLVAHHEETVGNPKLKSLKTSFQVLPDVTESDGQVTKLVVKLELGTSKLQEYDHCAVIEATLYDPTALSVLGQTRQEHKFAAGKDQMTLMVNLAAQKMVERSLSKYLQLIVHVKVCGYLRQHKYLCSEECNGFVNILEKKK